MVSTIDGVKNANDWCGARPSPRSGALGFASSVTAATEAAPASDPARSAAAENGTDPTQLLTVAEAKHEYLDLNQGISSGTLRLTWTQPIDAARKWAVITRVLVTSIDAGGNDSFDIGDASLKISHVYGLTKTHAWVAQGELIFDTAARPELGTGKDVFKGTLIYARFLKNGAIFAPAWVQSNSVAGQERRDGVNITTFDFYYVPKMADPRNLITYDPALNFDWQSDKESSASTSRWAACSARRSAAMPSRS